MKRMIGFILGVRERVVCFSRRARVADRGRSVRTNLADQNDSQATTNSQKQHKKHNVWIKRRIGCILGVRERVV
jgi:hypothetical protein